MAVAHRTYIDSSVILSQLLREGHVDHLDIQGEPCTSELTELECKRTLDRIRLQEQLTDEEVSSRLTELEWLLKSMRIIQLNGAVLRRAKGSYPTVVRSLDAIHLASAELSHSESFATFDKQQSVAARALGFATA